MPRPAFPEKTLRTRFVRPFQLQIPEGFARWGELDDAMPVDEDWLFTSRRGIVLVDGKKGVPLALWPQAAADEGWMSLPVAPLLFGGRVVALDQSGDVIHVLSPRTLTPIRSRRLDSLPVPLDPTGRRLIAWGAGAGEEIVVQFGGTREGHPLSVVAVFDAEGEPVRRIEVESPLEVRLWTSLGTMLIGVAKETLLIQDTPDSAAWRMLPLEGGPYDVARPSPDGRWLILTGDGCERFALWRLDEEPASFAPRLSGCYLIPGPNHNGGWIFWDKDTPKHLQLLPTPLYKPRVAYSEDSTLAVLGDAQGLSALIDLEGGRAVKLMTPPQSSVWPLCFHDYNHLKTLNGRLLASLRINWGDDNELPESDPEPPPLPPPPQPSRAGRAPEGYGLWLGMAALLGFLLMIAAWARWLR